MNEIEEVNLKLCMDEVNVLIRFIKASERLARDWNFLDRNYPDFHDPAMALASVFGNIESQIRKQKNDLIFGKVVK